jgi:hypothetical protein
MRVMSEGTSLSPSPGRHPPTTLSLFGRGFVIFHTFPVGRVSSRPPSIQRISSIKGGAQARPATA